MPPCHGKAGHAASGRTRDASQAYEFAVLSTAGTGFEPFPDRARLTIRM